ncbi:MAG: hypothetical protein HZA21_02715 [Nitrospirae bacterium]|nr:hypothetical protein [Nitrospirota bacterium]
MVQFVGLAMLAMSLMLITGVENSGADMGKAPAPQAAAGSKAEAHN